MSSGVSYGPRMNRPRPDLHPEQMGRRRRFAAAAPVTGGPGRGRAVLVAPGIVGLTVVMAVVMAACGSRSPKAGVASLGTTAAVVSTGGAAAGSPSSSGDPVKYASCMRSHGVVNFPEPNSPDAVSAMRDVKQEAGSPAFQAAANACARYAFHSAPPPPVSGQEMQKLLAVARCMRVHGIPSFPDPNPVTGDMAPPAGISRTSPIVLTALRACQPEARAAGLGPPSTGQ
jgi:hypothetical protein